MESQKSLQPKSNKTDNPTEYKYRHYKTKNTCKKIVVCDGSFLMGDFLTWYHVLEEKYIHYLGWIT